MEDIIIAKNINLEEYLGENSKLFNIEEAIRGDIKKIKTVDFMINGREGYIPHFHILGKNVDTCVCIFVPMYFHHRSHANTTFSGKTKESLNNFLMTQYKNEIVGTTVWMFLRNTWLELYYNSKGNDYKDALKGHFIEYGLYNPKSNLEFNPYVSYQPDYKSMYATIHERGN